jgi:uncharacterized protein YukE
MTKSGRKKERAMTLSLTPAEADAKIQQIQQGRDQAVAKLNQISDAQQSMLASTWSGGSATTYHSTSQGQREEFDDLIKTLDSVVEHGTAHIRAVANMDNS